MRFSGLFSALSAVSVVCAVTGSVCLTGCLGGDDTSVAPPPAADAGEDATAAKDSGAEVDAAEKDAAADANPFGG